MTAFLIIITAVCITALALPADARAAAVSSDHFLIVSDYVAAHERQQAREERYRRLRQRYLAWRQWRKLDVPRRVHRWAVAGIGDGYSRYAPSGLPWCALFAAFCVGRGEDGHPLPANPASTGSWRAAIRAEVRGLRRVFERRNVRPGDVVTFPYGHTGIVHKTHSGGFWSIEGNCTDRVRLRWHPWSAADTFGRVLFTKIPERFRCVTD